MFCPNHSKHCISSCPSAGCVNWNSLFTNKIHICLKITRPQVDMPRWGNCWLSVRLWRTSSKYMAQEYGTLRQTSTSERKHNTRCFDSMWCVCCTDSSIQQTLINAICIVLICSVLSVGISWTTLGCLLQRSGWFGSGQVRTGDYWEPAYEQLRFQGSSNSTASSVVLLIIPLGPRASECSSLSNAIHQ